MPVSLTRDCESSGFEGNLSPQQTQVFEALQARVTGTFQDDLAGMKFPNRYILRFLRATMKNGIFQLEEAERRLVDTLLWRRSHQVFDIRAGIEMGVFPDQYEFYRDEVRPRLQWIDEHTGRLVHMERLGKLTAHVNVQAFDPSTWDTFFITDMETIMMRLDQESETRGYEISTHVTVVDNTGLCFGGVHKSKAVLQQMNEIASQHYPELTARIYMLKSPFMLRALLSCVLSCDTFSKMEAVTVKALSSLLSNAQEHLPEEYDGNSSHQLGIPLHARQHA
jgi:hypothetical protein